MSDEGEEQKNGRYLERLLDSADLADLIKDCKVALARAQRLENSVMSRPQESFSLSSFAVPSGGHDSQESPPSSSSEFAAENNAMSGRVKSVRGIAMKIFSMQLFVPHDDACEMKGIPHYYGSIDTPVVWRKEEGRMRSCAPLAVCAATVAICAANYFSVASSMYSYASRSLRIPLLHVALALLLESFAAFVPLILQASFLDVARRQSALASCACALLASLFGNVLYMKGEGWAFYTSFVLRGLGSTISVNSMTKRASAMGSEKGLVALCLSFGTFIGACLPLLLPRSMHRSSSSFVTLDDTIGQAFLLACCSLSVLLPILVAAATYFVRSIFFANSRSLNAPTPACSKHTTPAQVYPAGIYVVLIGSVKWCFLFSFPWLSTILRGWNARACALFYLLATAIDILAVYFLAVLTCMLRPGTASLFIRFSAAAIASILRWHCPSPALETATAKWLPHGDMIYFFATLILYAALSLSLSDACSSMGARIEALRDAKLVRGDVAHNSTWKFRILGRIAGCGVLCAAIATENALSIHSYACSVFFAVCIFTSIGVVIHKNKFHR